MDADGGATVADVSAGLGVHPNTAREHLDALVSAGHCARAQMPAVGRGRPPMIYRAVPSPREVGPEYRALAEMLVAYMAEQWPDPQEQAVHAREAGERWVAGMDDDEQRRILVGAMFDPEPVPGTVPATGRDVVVAVRLRRCPVLALARRYPGVVCSVHLGIMRGALGEAADQMTLHPFAEAGACLLRIPSARVAPEFSAGQNRGPGGVSAPSPPAVERLLEPVPGGVA